MVKVFLQTGGRQRTWGGGVESVLGRLYTVLFRYRVSPYYNMTGVLLRREETQGQIDAQREELGNDRKLEWYIISQKKTKTNHPELWKTLEIRSKGGISFSSRAFREGIALSTL